MAAINFDANLVIPVGQNDPLPLGEYTVIITDSEINPTKKDKDKPASEQRNKYLQFVYEIVDGEYKGKKLWDRLNIMNETVTAQEIAKRSLSSICRSVGVIHPKETNELHNIPFVVKVGIRAASGDFAATNTIKEYKRCDGRKLTEITDIVDTPTTTTTAPKKALPWDKKK